MRVPFVDLKAQYATIREPVIQSISDTFSGMNLLLGPNVRAFETEFATYCQVQHAIGVGSGTDALYLALRACGIGPGDEVITVSNTFFATAEAIWMIGAKPVFVDIDPATYTLDPSKLEAAIGPHTRAIVPVHLFGQMADMGAIMAVAERHGLAVVEDACQAHGATDQGRRAGSIGDAAAFSFYMSKNLGAYGEAGMVTTNSHAVAETVRRLRSHGSTAKYEHSEIGVNSRLDEIQAVVLRQKLPHLDQWNRLRQLHATRYSELLGPLGVGLPFVRADATHVFHLYVIRVENRDRVRETLGNLGVETGVHYPIPIHTQVAARGLGRIAGSLRVTEEYSRQILSLPMYPELSPEQLGYVVDCIRTSVNTEEGIHADSQSAAIY